MTTTGDIEITINDGSAGAVVVPASSVQVVMGCSTSGTPGVVVATRSPQTLRTTFGYGPLVEAAALACLAGGTVLAMRCATVTPGTVTAYPSSALTITAATNASPIVVTSTAHGLSTGMVVTVASVGGNTAANGTFVITRVTADTFSLNGSTGNSAYTSGGTATYTGVQFSGTGTSVITVSLDGTNGAFDDYNFKFLVVHGGTRGTAGITFQISLDAGRNYGPVIALGTATTYAVTGTGITLNFAAGTLVANDYAVFSTVAMATATSNASPNHGVSENLTALQASPYATTGWGSMHILGPWTGANASTIDGYLATLQTGYVFSRAMLPWRDAKTPTAWGGQGETDATWAAAFGTDTSAVSAKRVLMSAGNYNMPSAFPLAAAGAPRYRRPLSWSQAVRQVQIPAQRHSGRVRDGALANIVVDPTNDPTDGFVYHDERINPGLDTARACSARTRIGLPGYFIVNPNLMSPGGSDFSILPYGAVMDVACSLVHQEAQQFINSDVRLNANGTIYENEARTIESAILGVINANMTAVGMISSARVQVDRTTNVQVTKKVTITVTIVARGYVLEEDITIGFSNSLAAA
jgi:hypothetical protein